jgi:hypothetical protein
MLAILGPTWLISCPWHTGRVRLLIIPPRHGPATCRIASVDVPLRLVLPVLTVQGLRIVAVLYK